MAAPTPTPRQTPSGFKMPEGFRALITFAKKPAIQLWERQVKLPGIDGGNPIDTTTQHNVKYHTMAPPSLIKLDPISIECMYDPDVIPDILAAINRNDTITITIPDGSTWCFYGWLQKWDAAAFEPGKEPMAAATICPSNWDATNNVEAAPVFTAAVGT